MRIYEPHFNPYAGGVQFFCIPFLNLPQVLFLWVKKAKVIDGMDLNQTSLLVLSPGMLFQESFNNGQQAMTQSKVIKLSAVGFFFPFCRLLAEYEMTQKL